MAKAKKSKSARKMPQSKTSKTPKTAEQMQNVRTLITNVIVDNSVAMTKRVTQYVSENGNAPALRFLWEIAGLFPTADAEYDNEPLPEGEALLERLGLYEGLPKEQLDGEGDVKSGDSQNAD